MPIDLYLRSELNHPLGQTEFDYNFSTLQSEVNYLETLVTNFPITLLNNSALTGIPTAPTASLGTSTTQVANTAFVAAALANLVASSPAALDTLNELAAALGNDPNFATTVTNSLALKAPLASPIFTGDPRAPTPSTSDNDTSIATTSFVRSAITAFTPPPLRTIGATWDGQSTQVQSGSSPDVYITVPNGGTIQSVTLTTQGGSGSCVIDVRKVAFASFPPNSGNSIVGSSPPTITGGVSSTDVILNGWNKTVTAGDVFAFHVTSSVVFTWIHIDLVYG